MNEYLTIYQATAGLIGLVVASLLYALGGREGKWQRRYLASFVLTLTVIGLTLWKNTFSFWYLLIFPILLGGFSLGYGAEATWWKIIRRLVYALAVCSAGLVFCFVLNNWWLFIPHIGIGLFSIYLGVKNPIESAAEEILICTLLNLILIFYPFLPA